MFDDAAQKVHLVKVPQTRLVLPSQGIQFAQLATIATAQLLEHGKDLAASEGHLEDGLQWGSQLAIDTALCIVFVVGMLGIPELLVALIGHQK